MEILEVIQKGNAYKILNISFSVFFEPLDPPFGCSISKGPAFSIVVNFAGFRSLVISRVVPTKSNIWFRKLLLPLKNNRPLSHPENVPICAHLRCRIG